MTVCVIIAARDAADTIGRAIGSALDQSPVTEVLLVDDGSKDGTAEAAFAAAGGDPRLRIERHAASLGPAAARNRALRLCRSEWLTPLDADDFFLPGRIAGLLEAAADCDFVADDLLVAPDGREGGPYERLLAAGPMPRMLRLSDFVLGNLTDPARPRHEMGFLKPLIRRAFLDEHALSYDETLRLGEDYVLYATALAKGARFRLAPAQGYVAVHRAGSLSASHGTEDLRALSAACERLTRVPSLEPEERAALRRHLTQVRRRLRLREFLDLKQSRGWAHAAAFAGAAPQDLPYLVGRLAADRLKPPFSTRSK